MKRWSLITVLLLLCACTSVTTRLAGWYVTRQINEFVDLTSEQKQWVRPAVDRDIERGRRVVLPDWLHLLRGVRDEIARGPSEQGTLALQLRYDELLDQAVDHLAGQFAPLFADLSDAQLTHFQKRLVRHVDEMFEDQKLPPDERQEAQDEKLIDMLEDLVGDLSDAQKAQVLRTLHALPDDRPLRYKNDRRRAYWFVAFLRDHRHDKGAIEAELKRLWATRFAALGPEHDLKVRRDRQRHFLLAIDALLTPEQRSHAVAHLNEQIGKLQRWALAPAES